MNSLERAMELMATPQRDLPPGYLTYARVLGQRYGLCMEVYISAFAAYAEIVEHRPCEDNEYRARPDAWAFFGEDPLRDEVEIFDPCL